MVNISVASVRRAYLEALPWGSFVQRNRALDLALLLLPIKKANEYRQLDQAIGRMAGNRHLALILTDAVRRWEAVVEEVADRSETGSRDTPSHGSAHRGLGPGKRAVERAPLRIARAVTARNGTMASSFPIPPR
jgi:hypothetical protein